MIMANRAQRSTNNFERINNQLLHSLPKALNSLNGRGREHHLYGKWTFSSLATYIYSADMEGRVQTNITPGGRPQKSWPLMSKTSLRGRHYRLDAICYVRPASDHSKTTLYAETNSRGRA
jgi:hypothetical protein